MKKLIFVLVILIFSICLFTNVSALDVDLLSYDPYPVVPADSFIVEFEIENNEASILNDIELRLDVDDPFSLLSSEQQEISSLDVDDAEVVDFKIYVDGDADPDDYDIVLEYRVDGGDWQEEDFEIRVRESEVFLEIVSVVSEPEKISPSESARVTISLRNKAESSIKDVVVKLDLSGEIPIAPIGSATEKMIDNIRGSDEEQVVFDVIALQEAELKTYKIPLMIEYRDEYGERYEKEDLISLTVSSKPNLVVLVEENELVQGMKSRVVIKILNNGLGGTYFLSAMLIESPDYDIVGKNEEYIGEIDSDDFDTFDFMLVPKKAGNIPLQLKITYKDSENKEYMEQVILNPRVYTAAEAQQIGLLAGNSTITIVVVVVVVVVVFFFWRRWRKKRKAKEEEERANRAERI
jgi:hypothetical protein